MTDARMRELLAEEYERQDRIEQAGWELAEASRAFDRAST